tara:strand:+ start:207 stop:416 length:210 start_codon:yes stop_codon:yes gene_type:complete
VIKEIEIGDLVRIAPNKASYGNQSDIVGLVVALISTTPQHNWETSVICARVEWTNGVQTLNGLPVLELV